MKKLTFILLITLTLSAFSQVPNYSPTNGLVGWWQFNGNANDESGNGNNGAVNGATLTADRFGNSNSAYDFDGVNDNISIPHSNSFVFNSYSVSIWAQMTGAGSPGKEHWSIIMKNNSPERFDDVFHISHTNTVVSGFFINNSNELFADIGGGNSSMNTTIFSGQSLSDNSWHNIVVVFDDLNNIHNIYFDGTLISSTIVSYSPIQNTDPIKIGYWLPYLNYFKGKIDDIGIWNRAITSCEIADLYNAQVGSLNTTSTTTVTNCENYNWNNQTYTQSGQYTFQTTNVAGCDSTATLNLTITQPTSGSETITECYSFTWGANNQTYNQSGQYTAVLTNAEACDSTAILNLTITQPSSGAETVTACDAYTWSANNQTYNQSGQYTAVLTNAAGCDSTATLNLSINTVDNGITQIDDISLQANASNAQYQWVDCSDNYQTISGETNQTFEATVNGNYAVIVTQNGCSDTTACITISKVGLENLNATLFTIYPNPAKTLIAIQSEVSLNTKYSILDAQGRKVLKGKLEGLSVSVDIEHLANGMYTIQFEQAELKEINFIKE
jgi:hypothetical protein